MKIKLGQERQFRYWRLNVSILNYPLIQQELCDKLKEYIEKNDNGDVTPCILWDGATAVMRGHIIQITSRTEKTKGSQETIIGD